MRDRNGLVVLDRDACVERLRSAVIGRVVFTLAGRPFALPVTFALDGRQAVVFRTGRGSKLASAERDAGPVAFQADAYDTGTRSGWSVLVHGQMDHVVELAEIARLDGLRLRPWADQVRRPHWVRIAMERVSGREIVRDGG